MEVVIIFKVVFIFEGIFIFEVVFTFKVVFLFEVVVFIFYDNRYLVEKIVSEKIEVKRINH